MVVTTSKNKTKNHNTLITTVGALVLVVVLVVLVMVTVFKVDSSTIISYVPTWNKRTTPIENPTYNTTVKNGVNVIVYVLIGVFLLILLGVLMLLVYKRVRATNNKRRSASLPKTQGVEKTKTVTPSVPTKPTIRHTQSILDTILTHVNQDWKAKPIRDLFNKPYSEFAFFTPQPSVQQYVNSVFAFSNGSTAPTVSKDEVNMFKKLLALEQAVNNETKLKNVEIEQGRTIKQKMSEYSYDLAKLIGKAESRGEIMVEFRKEEFPTTDAGLKKLFDDMVSYHVNARDRTAFDEILGEGTLFRALTERARQAYKNREAYEETDEFKELMIEHKRIFGDK